MPASLVRQSNLVVEQNVDASNVTGATINGVASGNTLIAVVVAIRSGMSSGDIISGYGTTIGGSAANTWSLMTGSRIAYSSGSGRRTEITWWIASNVSAGNTVGKPTFAFSDDSTQVYTHLDEWSGISASSPVDKAKTASAAAGNATIATGSSGTLSQASELVLVAWGNRWCYQDPPTIPSGYTAVRSIAGNNGTNPLLAGRTFYKEVSATTAVDATVSQTDDFDGSVISLVTLKLGSTTLRLEIDDIDETDITGTTGWTIGAWSGDPFTTTANKVWTGYSASVSGGKLILPDAPSGASAGSTYNVVGYQPSGTKMLAFCSGTVRAAS
jgi:hypothetical protein